MDLARWKATLLRAGVAFTDGLTGAQIARCEELYDITFPADLAEMLQYALPTGPGWPNWRKPEAEAVAAAFAWPLVGLQFDIQHNGFWLAQWGAKPASLESAFEVAAAAARSAPVLIPICGHRYLPDRPRAGGNPVLSVYQTDVLYYGADLEEYFANEFSCYFRGPRAQHVLTEPLRRIEFWSDLIDG